MRSSPLRLAAEADKLANGCGESDGVFETHAEKGSHSLCDHDFERTAADTCRFDLILASSMLDLPTWIGFVKDKRLMSLPTAMYFHENQWMYPNAPDSRVDHHYGYTNLLSALAADACLFNSAFHRDGFITASKQFVQRMPDSARDHDFTKLEGNCHVIYPGFDPPPQLDLNLHLHADCLTLGWVARWEQDKNPMAFQRLLRGLRSRGIEFQLILLGERGRQTCTALEQIQSEFAERILFNGFARNHENYWHWLSQIDAVVSTAHHEFFGIGVCEAIWAGAIPVLPNRLSYPELVPQEFLYEDLVDAEAMIASLCDSSVRQQQSKRCRNAIKRFQSKRTVEELDNWLESV